MLSVTDALQTRTPIEEYIITVPVYSIPAIIMFITSIEDQDLDFVYMLAHRVPNYYYERVHVENRLVQSVIMIRYTYYSVYTCINY